MGLIVVPALETQKRSFTYAFSGGKPSGMYEDAERASMLPAILSGTALKETPPTGADATLRSYALAPDSMATRTYTATAICSNVSNGTNRGMGVVVAGSDGAGGPGVTNLVFIRAIGSGGSKINLYSKVGLTSTAVVQAQSTATGLVSPSDTLSVQITFDGTYYTYTGFKNGTAIPGCAWTDTTAVIGTPGKSWGCTFEMIRSGAINYASLGCYGISAADT